MITVISGTNRKNNRTSVFAAHYAQALAAQTSEEVKLLDLATIAQDWMHVEMYDGQQQTPSLTAIQDEYILPATKFVIITPEYNGSYPGVLKTFIDGCSVRKYQKNFRNKKAVLAGISSGRAGNLRGMMHLAGVLNYVGVHVHPSHFAYPTIDNAVDMENRKIVDEKILGEINTHITDILNY